MDARALKRRHPEEFDELKAYARIKRVVESEHKQTTPIRRIEIQKAETNRIPKRYNFGKYARPKLGRPINSKEEDLDFFYLGATYDVPSPQQGPIIQIYGLARCPSNFIRDPQPGGIPNNDNNNNAAPNRLSDPNKVETTIKINATGFLPHFWIAAKPEWTDQVISDLIQELEFTLREKYPWSYHLKKMIAPEIPIIQSYKRTKNTVLEGFRGKKVKVGDEYKIEEEVYDMIDIYLCNPKFVPALRHILEYPAGCKWTPGNFKKKGNGGNGKYNNNNRYNYGDNVYNNYYRNESKPTPETCTWNFEPFGIVCEGLGKESDVAIYEADLDFKLRFTTDNLLQPSSWYRLKAGTYSYLAQLDNSRTSKCEIEVTTHFTQLKLLKEDPDAESFLPNIRNLSFDTEFYTNGTRFPVKGLDDCLQIGVVTWDQNTSNNSANVVLAVGHIEPKKVEEEPIDVFTYEKVGDMLADFKRLVDVMDPDTITGHNINGFDFPYLIELAKTHKVAGFDLLSRSKNRPISSKVKEAKGRKVYNTTCEGRVIRDILNEVLTTKQYEDNTLGAVSKELVVDKSGKPVTKAEFDVTMISLFQQTQAGREKMRDYVWKDAWLPKAICGTLGNPYLVVSRIAKIEWQTCLDREQGAKIEGRLRQECFGCSAKPGEFFINRLKKTLNRKEMRAMKGIKLKGAQVIRPKPGFYPEPVITLDAASMYPSIVIMRNLCFTTMVTNEEIAKNGYVEGVDFWRLKDYVFHEDYIEEIDNPNNPAFMIPKTVTVKNPVTGKEETVVLHEGILPRLERVLGAERGGIRGAQMPPIKNEMTELKRILDEGSIDWDEADLKAKPEVINYREAILEYNELCKEMRENKEMDQAIKKKKKSESIRSLNKALKALSELMKLVKLSIAEIESKPECQNAAEQLAKLKIKYNLLDDAQVAIKMWMNSIFGISGDPNSKYYRPEIAAAITATGRWMINTVKIAVEKEFTRKNGYPFDAIVIYGDTDSVMIWLCGFGKCVPAAFSFGVAMRDHVNKLFVDLKPAKFAFEKIYFNYNIVKAKHYFALKYMPVEEGDSKPKVDTKGMRHKKRGTGAFFSTVSKKCCDIIATKGDLQEALTYARQQIELLRTRKVHVSDFEKRQKLSKDVLKYSEVQKDEDDDYNDMDNAADDDNNNSLVIHDPESDKVKKNIPIGPAVQLARDTMTRDGLRNLKLIIKEPFYTPFNPNRTYPGDVDANDISIPVYMVQEGASVRQWSHMFSLIGERYPCAVVHMHVADDEDNQIDPSDNTGLALGIQISPQHIEQVALPSSPFIAESENSIGQAKPVFTLKLSIRTALGGSSVQYGAGDYIPYVVMETDEKKAKVSSHVADPYDAMLENYPIDVKYYMKELRNNLLKIFQGILGYGRKPGTPEHKLLQEVTDKKTGQIKYKLSNSQEREITKLLFGYEMIDMVKVHKPILATSALFRHLVKKPVCINCNTIINPDTNKLSLEEIPEEYQRLPEFKREKLTETICSECISSITDISLGKKKEMNAIQSKRKECTTKCIECLGPGSEDIIDKCTNRTCPIFRQKVDIADKIKQLEELIPTLLN
jgi:DNA polymerase elongation subunit (family B)